MKEDIFLSDRQKIECIASRTRILLITLAYKYIILIFFFLSCFHFQVKLCSFQLVYSLNRLCCSFEIVTFNWIQYAFDRIQRVSVLCVSLYIMLIFVSIVHGILECIALMTQSTMMQ